jgi:hypothetical protein
MVESWELHGNTGTHANAKNGEDIQTENMMAKFSIWPVTVDESDMR